MAVLKRIQAKIQAGSRKTKVIEPRKKLCSQAEVVKKTEGNRSTTYYIKWLIKGRGLRTWHVSNE